MTLMTYRLRIHDAQGRARDEMYTHGEPALTPELAKECPGTMRALEPGESLYIERVESWNDARGERCRDIVVIERVSPATEAV